MPNPNPEGVATSYHGEPLTGHNFEAYMIQGYHDKLNGLQGREMDKLPVDHVATPVDTLCSICQHAAKGDVATLPCGHRFHIKCIRTWTATHVSCPDCRTVIGKASKRVRRRSIGWSFMSIGYRALLFSAGHDPVFERPRKYTIQTSDARFLAMLMTVLRSPSYWCRREDAVKDARFCCEKWREDRDERQQRWQETWGATETSSIDECHATQGSQSALLPGALRAHECTLTALHLVCCRCHAYM